MNPSDHEPDADYQQALDRLIRDTLATGREAMRDARDSDDAERLTRLQRFWRDESRRRVARRWRSAAAAAAAVLVAATLAASWLMMSRSDPKPPRAVARQGDKTNDSPPAQRPPSPAPTSPMTQEATAVEPPETVVVPSDFARAPTAYERWMFAAQTNTPAPRLPPPPVEPIEPPASPVEQAMIIAEAADRDAWPAIVREIADPAVRGALAGALLDDAGEPALIAFLEVLRGEATRDAALDAADAREQLPIDQFVSLLDHETPQVRLAASMALGLLNRCEMTDALITRVETRPSRSKEAWFALFGCRCESASVFLSRAAASPKLLGQFNNARIQFGRTWPVWKP